jgi:phosphoribosylaminoimidazolecarboxamide formyltransferase/IMP cyclohydrolase
MVRAAEPRLHRGGDDPADYAPLAAKMKRGGGQLGFSERYALAAKAFSHTAEYDGMISNWLTARNANGDVRPFPDRLNLQLRLGQSLRYGENPHQSAAFYVSATPARYARLHPDPGQG